MKTYRGGVILAVVVGVLSNVISSNIVDESNHAVDKMSVVQMENVVDEREIKLVELEFAVKKHKWYVRLSGILLIALPFLITPLEPLVKKLNVKTHRLAMELMYAPKSYVDEADKGRREEVNKILGGAMLIYLTIFYLLLWLSAYFLGFDPAQYSLLIVEKILNAVLGLI